MTKTLYFLGFKLQIVLNCIDVSVVGRVYQPIAAKTIAF